MSLAGVTGAVAFGSPVGLAFSGSEAASAEAPVAATNPVITPLRTKSRRLKDWEWPFLALHGSGGMAFSSVFIGDGSTPLSARGKDFLFQFANRRNNLIGAGVW